MIENTRNIENKAISKKSQLLQKSPQSQQSNKSQLRQMDGWEIKSFEDCLEKVIYTTKIQRKDFLVNGDYPIISQENEFINGYWNNPADLFEIKKPVVIFGDHTQTLKYVDFNFVLGADGVKILQVKDNINPRYFYYYLKNISLQILGYARHYRLLKDINVRFPKSINKQQQIVSFIDESFASITQVKENLERNLQNAKELFESELTNVFTTKGQDWEEKMLKDIGITQTGTTPKTSDKKNYGDFIPFIKPADIDIIGNGEIRYDNDGLSEQGVKNGRKMLAGSILMVCIGATIGKIGFTDRDVSCNQQINSLTVKKEFYPMFFYYALSTTSFFEKVIHNSAQATLPIINKGKWEVLTVSYPKSFSKQQSIVTKLNALSTETKKLETIYQQKINDLEELKRSILQKAFTGELI